MCPHLLVFKHPMLGTKIDGKQYIRWVRRKMRKL